MYVKDNTKIQLGKYYLDLTNKELDNEQKTKKNIV
jgi:hypothetical protein